MSEKNRDNKRRWRSITVGFRVSPQESDTINMMVLTSGLTKQDYCTKRLLCEDIIVHPNIRVQKYLRDYLVNLTEELKRLEQIDQSTDVLENIKYLLELIVKLSPNVTDITEIARAVEASGADSVSLINTLLGMAIDAEKRRPVLSTITGGMSGAAVKPIALRMVWQVSKAVKIPVIGLGGIMNWKDAVEFLLAGASAIQIGTANFIDPDVTVKVADGINDYLDRHGFTSVKDIIGGLIV